MALAVGVLTFLLGLITAIQAQNTVEGICIPGSGINASLPLCSSLQSSLDACDAIKSQTAGAFLSCFCKQDLFDAIRRCENEQHLCIGSDIFAADAEALISVWHSGCDTRISYTPTTLPLSPITVKQDPRCTGAIGSALATFTSLGNICVSSYTSNATSLNSCLCQSSVLSAAFSAEYVQNVTCLGDPVVPSKLFGAGCANYSVFYSKMLSSESSWSSRLYSPATVNASTTSTRSSGTATSSSNLPPSLPSRTSTAPTSTSSTSDGTPTISHHAVKVAWLMLVLTLV